MIRAPRLIPLLAILFLLPGSAFGQGGDFRSQLLKKDSLVIGTSPDYPPYESLDGDKLVGFDIELFEAVGAALGLKVEWSQMNFDNILVAVPAGQVDIGVSAFTFSEERAKNLLFNKVPYLKTAQVAFVKADSKIKTVEDFQGHHFYAGLGTTGEGALKEINGVQISNTMDYQIAFEMLGRGQLDGVVCDVAVGEGYVKSLNLRAIEPPLVDEENFTITRLGNDALAAAIDAELAKIMKTEAYEALRLKFGL
ncbi:MAG: transporter substrate-binding domain-containing protein [Candidatus Adiutrix sp.]|jgi:polar amino acid transport system substrate-binding protein|nr:transporter substrate-binding domain-containing protein [Candidatus Adiutrix sp.]